MYLVFSIFSIKFLNIEKWKGRKMRIKNSVPLYIQLKNRLRERILSNPDLQILPSTKELAQEYGVGKNTIDQALEMLVSENLICRIRHRGTVCTRHQDISDPQRNTKSIGIIFPASGLETWQEMFDAMQRRAHYSGYTIEIYLYNEMISNDIQMKINHARKQCAGLCIYLCNDLQNPVEDLLRNKYPIVISGQAYEGHAVSSVTADNFTAASDLTDRFIQIHCRKIALTFGKTMESSFVRRRIEGWRQTCRKFKVESPDDLIFFECPGWEEKFRTFLRRKRPDAIIFSNNGRERQKAKLIMEQEGMADLPCAAFLSSNSVFEHVSDLSFIAEIPSREFGENIAQLLLNQLAGEMSSHQKIEVGIRIHKGKADQPSPIKPN